MYNTTNISDAGNLYELVYHVNQLADGWIGIAFLLTIFLLQIIVYHKYEKDLKESMVASSMTTAILSVLFFFAQLISWKILIYPILILFASILLYKFTD